MKKIFKKSSKDRNLELDGRTKLGKSVKEVEKTLGILGGTIYYLFICPIKFCFLIMKFLARVLVFSCKLLAQVLIFPWKFLARSLIVSIKFLVKTSIAVTKKLWLKIRQK